MELPDEDEIEVLKERIRGLEIDNTKWRDISAKAIWVAERAIHEVGRQGNDKWFV